MRQTRASQSSPVSRIPSRSGRARDVRRHATDSPARLPEPSCSLYRGGRLREALGTPSVKYVRVARFGFGARESACRCVRSVRCLVCGACKTHGIFFLATIMIRATRTLRAPFVQLQDQAVK